MPARRRRTTAPERAPELLLEREAELEAADTALAEALDGEGGSLLIEGSAGIGKTSLIREIAGRASRCGFLVHHSGGDELASSLPYGVVRQLFGASVVRDRGQRDAVADGPGSGALDVLGDSPGPGAAGEPANGASLAYSLYWFTQELAEEQPRVLCVDDAQWADPDSLRALAFLLRRLDGIPVLVALGARRDAPPEISELLSLCREAPRARVLRLAPLAAASVAELARRQSGVGASQELAAGLLAATGGNPFLVHEVLVALATTGWSGLDADPAQLGRLAPSTVARFVLRRLAAAGDAARRLARSVSVLGEAPLDQAAKLAELDQAQAVSAADRLADGDILGPDLHLRFVHPILREAVRADIPVAHLALMHARAARLLDERGAGPEEVAAHLLEALPHGDPWTVEVLVDAARRAGSRGSPEIAATLLARALSEPPAAAARSPVAVELGSVEVILGRADGIETLRSAAQGAVDDPQLAQARLALARALFMVLDTAGAVALLEELAVDPTVDADVRLRLEGELLGAARRHGASRSQVLQRLDALADDARPPRPASVGVLANLALSAVERNAGPEAVAELAELALTDGWLFREQSNQAAYVINALTWVDRVDQAVGVAGDVLAWATRIGSLTMSTMACTTRSRGHLRRGAVLDAEADARIGHAVALEHGWDKVLPFTSAQLANALMERGEVDEAASLLAIAGSESNVEAVPDHLYSSGLVCLAQLRPERALEHFLACGGQLEAQGGVDAPGVLPWRSSAAAALLALGDARRARRMADEEHQLAVASGVPGSIGTAQIALGLAHGGEAGVGWLWQAVQTLEGSIRVLTRARALIELGAMTRRQGHPAAARPHLARALDLARGCGATAVVERARAELRAAGARPRRDSLTGVESLTASERRVADMVASGLSNREVAHQLYLSMRTVATHLTHVYQKLGVDGREEIAGRLGREKLRPP